MTKDISRKITSKATVGRLEARNRFCAVLKSPRYIDTYPASRLRSSIDCHMISTWTTAVHSQNYSAKQLTIHITFQLLVASADQTELLMYVWGLIYFCFVNLAPNFQAQLLDVSFFH